MWYIVAFLPQFSTIGVLLAYEVDRVTSDTNNNCFPVIAGVMLGVQTREGFV